MEILKLGGFVSAVNIPTFRRVFQKFSDSNIFPANLNLVYVNPIVPGAKTVLNVNPQLCISGGSNDSWNGSGSNGQGGGFNNHYSGDDDHSGHPNSGLVLLGMQALLQGIDEGWLFEYKLVYEILCFLICQCVSTTLPAYAQCNNSKHDSGRITHGHAGKNHGTNQKSLSVRYEESQNLQTSMSNSDCGTHKQNDLPLSNVDTFLSSHDVLRNEDLELSKVDFDVSDNVECDNKCHRALEAVDIFFGSLLGKLAHIGWKFLRGNQGLIVTPLVHVEYGHEDMTISDQDDGSLVEGHDFNRALNIDGPCEKELLAIHTGEMNVHASGKQAQLDKPNSVQRYDLKEIDFSSVTASDRLLQGGMGWFEQLGRPVFAKQVANHEFTSEAEQVVQQESRVLSSESATTAPKIDNETGVKPLGAKQSDIDTLKRLQREAFFELMKLREKLEQATQVRQKQERLGAARTHLKGQVKAGTAFVVLEDENISHSRDSLEQAGMQTGLDVKFTFETPFRKSDVLITQILAGQGSSMDDGRALGGPLRLGKLHYIAHLNDDVSFSIVPLGAQGHDVTEIVNVLQDQGLTSFSSQGPALFNHCKGSVLGAIVSGSKFAFSFAQYLSGWGNHVSATESLMEEDPLCYSTLCQLLFQPTEGFILSFCGLNSYWPTPPLPSSGGLHWSEMGPLIFPRIKSKKANFYGAHLDVSTRSDMDRVHPHWECPGGLESGPATFQTKGTGLLSLAVSSSLDLGENVSLSGWVQVEKGELLQDRDKRNFQWAMCLAKNSGSGIDWGASIGGSRHDIWHMPSRSSDDYSADAYVDSHGLQLHVEAFLKLNCGKGFTLQPGLLYVSNKSSHTPAILVRSSWSL